MAENMFSAAVDHVKKAQSLSMSNKSKLQFYALFKQATDGDCQMAEPSRMNMVAHAKWSAWKQLRGMKAEKAMEEYTNRVRAIDCSFQPQTKIKMESSSSIRHHESKVRKSKHLEKHSSGGRSRFLLSISFCALLCGVGILGFLTTTLSHKALFFLGLLVMGWVGIVAAIVKLIGDYGLIALYSPELKKVLLERTLVETILDGTIMQKFKDAFTEISPVFYCKTREDRIAALQNMSQSTRRMMTTLGVVNVLPMWQQKLLLSRKEFQRQKKRLEDEKIAFRPPLVQGLGGHSAPVRDEPELEEQRKLASKLFRRTMQDSIANTLLNTINPKYCVGASGSLAVMLLLQLRLSDNARRVFAKYLKSSALGVSSTGMVLFAILAVFHRIAARYSAYRKLKIQGDKEE